MIILGIGGIRAMRPRRLQGRRLARGRGRSQTDAPQPEAVRRSRIQRYVSSPCAWRTSPREVDCRRHRAPVSARFTSHCCARSFPTRRIVMVEHHAAHAASAYYPSPFRRSHRADARPRRRFPLRHALARRRQPPPVEARSVFPDSLGDLYGRVTELLGFAAEPTSTKCSGSPPPTTPHTCRSSKKFSAFSEWPRHRPQLLRCRSASATAASAQTSTSALGLEDGDRHSAETAGARSPPACSAPSKDAVLRMAGPSEQSVPGRRPGSERAAGRPLESFGNRTSSCSPPPAMPAPPSAPCSTPGTALSGQSKRASLNDLCLGPSFHRRRNQAGARKLQAALPLPADHR